MRRLMSFALILAASAAFAQSGGDYASHPVTPQGFQLPAGGDCAAEIARYRAIQDNDFQMGQIARSVHEKIAGEIAAAERECSAGHDARARSLLVASKTRHGYPVGE